MVALFSHLRYPRSIDHQSNFSSAVKVYLMNIQRRTFVPDWCTRPWSFDDIVKNCIPAPDLNRHSWGVWPSAKEVLHVSEIAITLHCFCHQLSWSPQWTNTDEVPPFTRRASSLCNSMCSDLCGVDLSWFQFSSTQASINSIELPVKLSLGFSSVRMKFEDFSASLELICFLHG